MSSFWQKLAAGVCKASPNRFYSYQSAISLSNLYPNSSLKLTTPIKPPNEGQDKFTGYVPINKLDITYSRSTGPGGQNVNKINTKVEVRFHLGSASWINEDVRQKLLDKYKNKITKDGFVIYRSDLTRSQQLNLADCLEKIRSSIRSCLVEESTISEETAERLRRRHERAVIARLALKRNKSQIKNERRGPEINKETL